MFADSSVQAISFGPAVRQVTGSAGRVLAVLSKAVYIDSGFGHMVGIVSGDAPDGPFSLRVEALPALVAGLHGREGSAYAATQHEICFAGGQTISMLHAHPWIPRLPSVLGTVEQRVLAIDTLRALLLSDVQPERLCEILRPADKSAGYREQSRPAATTVSPRRRTSPFVARGFIRRAEPVPGFQTAPESCSPLAEYLPTVCGGGRFPEMQGQVPSRTATALNAFLDALEVDDLEAGAGSLQLLLGLGPGLTPSGDDLLAGLIACLRWHERIGAFDSLAVNALANAILSAAPERTNRISQHLLRYACEGLLYEPAMDLGARLLAGEHQEMAEPASRLLQIGSSSGADMAVGIALGCAIAAQPKAHSRQRVNSSLLTLNP